MKNERGTAMILVMALLLVVAMMVVVNGNVVLQLRGELRRIDRQQQQRLHEQNPHH